MSIAQDVFEALHYMPGPVSAKEIHARARGLRYSPEKIECALRMLTRRGIVVETRKAWRGEPALYLLTSRAAKANEAAETGAGGACEAKVVPLAHKDGKAAENGSEAVSQDSDRGGFMVVLCRGKLDESIRDAIVRRGFRMAGIDCYHGHSAYHFERRGE